ncbi:Sodium-dependent nutrient amino acid transporter 1 [Diplonema papillatum]|nr:Sodium-dependent nutrient amino acid transporter 1 [Diplonema papillatum]
MPATVDAGNCHEGLDGWSRDKDNRLRKLTMAREREGRLADDEQAELEVLEKENESFIRIGLEFQRGEGIKTSDSIVVLLGYAIGLGNVWRFPYLAAKFGGLSFVIAYLVCCVFVSHPIYLLELALGQTTRKSTVFAMAEVGTRWTGVGFACIVTSFLVQMYYTVLVSYCAVYVSVSFESPLPWAPEFAQEMSAMNMSILNITPAEYYWRSTILGQDVENETSGLGDMQGHLVLALFVTYVFIFAAVVKGISVGAKLIYVTVIVPVLMMLVLLVRALMLEGAAEGIKFFVGRFDAAELVNPVMWGEACAQSLFSILFLPGTTMTLASFMRSKEDIYRINLIVMALDTLYSFIAGFVVFAILGSLSHAACHDGTDVTGCRTVEQFADESGGGLAFVALAGGIAHFGSGANFFSVLFFFTCYTLGLDTSFAGVETLVTCVDDYCKSRDIVIRREFIVIGCISLLFVCGLIFCTSNGFALLDVVDHYVTTYVMLLICAFECIMLSVDVTWEAFAVKIQLATTGLAHINNGRGRELPWFIRLCLHSITPAVCILLACAMFIRDLINPYGPPEGDSYAPGYQATGWTLMAVFLLIPPLGGWYALRQQRLEAEDKPLSFEMLDPVPLLDDEPPAHSSSTKGVDYEPPQKEDVHTDVPNDAARLQSSSGPGSPALEGSVKRPRKKEKRKQEDAEGSDAARSESELEKGSPSGSPTAADKTDTDTDKTDADKADTDKTDADKTDADKTDADKTDADKTDADEPDDGIKPSDKVDDNDDEMAE